jgi:4-amino-4-deoxy-L-arabinose transferase-like glycosyltransferase
LASLRKLLNGGYDATFTATSMIGIAFFIRMAVVLLTFHAVAGAGGDHAEFGWEMGWTARSVALGHGFSGPFQGLSGPTALVPPLYVYLLAGVFKLFGLYTARSAFVILTLNAIFSSLTCLPLYLAIRQLLGHRAGAIAGWAWVVYPYSIYFSSSRVWDYALTACLFCTCFLVAQRLHRTTRIVAWIGFGILYGISVLSNPSIATMLPVFLMIALWRVRQDGGPWLRNGLLTLLAFGCVMSPWVLRNERTLHIAAPLRDGFWLEAYAGNHGDTFESNPGDSHPASNAHEMQLYLQQGEVKYMAQKKAMTLAWVEHHPVAFAVVSLRRVVRIWTGFWSLSNAYLTTEPLDLPDIFFCSSITLLMFLGLRRWWRADRWSVLPYAALLVLFPLPYYLTHASPDYRQPMEPAVVALAAVGAFGLKLHDGDEDASPEELDLIEDEAFTSLRATKLNFRKDDSFSAL